MTVAIIDLDHFKIYNDTYGHAAGDDFLRRFASEAADSLREHDLFVRWGGEEFVIALPDTTTVQAEAVLGRIQRAVPDEQTCSIGYTAYRRRESLGHTIDRADRALYHAKHSGRNCLVRV